MSSKWAYNICSVYYLILIILVNKSATVDGQESKNVDGDNLATRMQAINEDLDRQLQDVMNSQAVNFTTVNISGLPYNASTKFNPKGMGQLYNVTNKFIDLVQSKQAFPEGIISIKENRLKFADPAEEWKIIVTHYAGLAVLAAAGLLIAIILPCVGLFFCCCRCAGQCGARSQPFDKKHDHCRKIILSIFLIGVSTIILFGVVCAFVTNESVQEGIEGFPDQMRTSLEDVELYMTMTKMEVNNLLKTNYGELERTMNNILLTSGKIITDELEIYSHAVSLTNLNDIVSGLDEIREDLKMINKITQELRMNASQLDIVIRGVKKDLLDTLTACTMHACKQVLHEYRINQLSIQIDFDKLPDVTPSLRNIIMLMEDDIVSEVSQGRESFLKIQKDIQRAVNQTIPVVSASIKKAGNSLAKAALNITSLIDRINRDIRGVYKPRLRIAKDNIDQYSLYRYYLGLAVSGVLLTVLTCLTFGLLCGICGKRPDGYGDDCCNKGAGARFLMMAVWMIFLFTSVLMVVTVSYMITGAVAQRGICEPLNYPNDNRMFELVDDFVQIKRLLYPENPTADIDMNWIVSACHANETLYKVLKLDYIMDLDSLRQYAERYAISSTIDELRKMINLSPGVVILSESAMSKLNDLAQSGLSDIEFHQYAELLNYNITNINIERLAIELRDISDKVPDGQKAMRDRLRKIAHDLEHYHRDLVVPMTLLSEQLTHSAAKLEKHIKFNHGSMAEAIHSLVEEVKSTQQFLNDAGPRYVHYFATKFGDALIRLVDDFLEHLVKSTRDQIGRCGPVSNAYNATLVAGCNRILDPFNGFWASVGWCLILFIPTIVLCVKLGSLYQKSDPYPGPLVESGCLYDAYAADRDNVPLAQVHDKKYSSQARQHANAYVESCSVMPEGYNGSERMPESFQGSSHHDSRYSDLAPKNWNYPNGGPPGYAPPVAAAPPPISTEYERPPPYYFPGPGISD